MTAILIIIYISFISLGLPDSLLGSAWPAINQELNIPLAYAGIASMITAGGTIVSSFFSDRIIRRFGTSKVTVVSVAMTAGALLGFSQAGSFWWMCLMAVPLGLGAGSVDAALNNFVALHYRAHHMSWLHCFWGIGATSGPFILSLFLAQQGGWKMGYRVIGTIQVVLVAALLVTLPLWKKAAGENGEETEENSKTISFGNLLKMPGAKAVLLSFFCYCGIELTAGLWGSSYFVIAKGIPAETAAKWISLYYLGITLGRLICGFITFKMNNEQMIRTGFCFIGAGVLCVMIAPINLFLQLGMILIGVGCAPIYPSMLHETPNRFGKELSQSLMGVQMACAYVGSTFMPPIFGLIAQYVNISLFPFFLLILLVIMTISNEQVNLAMRRRQKEQQQKKRKKRGRLV